MCITTKLIDCYNPLRPEDAGALKDLGYVGVCRYLGAKTQGWGKGLTPLEVQGILSADLSIVSIWEGNPTSASYFTRSQAQQDARDALIEAAWVGQPEGTAIYFAVDYDAIPWDMAAIDVYFDEIRLAIEEKYKIGVYGGIRVMHAMYAARDKPDYYWQTRAWSDGQVFAHAHLYQSENSQTVAGLSVDIDIAYQEPGWWPQREFGVQMQSGSSGETVKELQVQLNASLGTHIAEDGKYGAATESAIKAFQVINHLPVTGVADSATQSLLKTRVEQRDEEIKAAAENMHTDKITHVMALLAQAQNLIKSL